VSYAIGKVRSDPRLKDALAGRLPRCAKGWFVGLRPSRRRLGPDRPTRRLPPAGAPCLQRAGEKRARHDRPGEIQAESRPSAFGAEKFWKFFAKQSGARGTANSTRMSAH
jgi:hypothetical protein